MTTVTDWTINTIAQECYDRALAEGISTRVVAAQLIESADISLVHELAIEFLVSAVARAARLRTLEAERQAERANLAQSHESAGAARSAASRTPRKGTRARDEWERLTPEGRAWVKAEEDEWVRSQSMVHGALAKALDRYAEDLRIQWTTELLDSTFTLPDGTQVAWGDATISQHEERRDMFARNAHANLEGAARHDVAIRDLRASGNDTLRCMVTGSAV